MPFVKWLLGGFHFSRGFLIMENLSKMTNQDIHNFILGCVEMYQLNDSIDEQKQLEFIVSNDGFKFHVKYIWFTGVKHYKSNNPITDRESDWTTNDNYFSLYKTDSLRKLAKEVNDAIEVVNEYEFNEY